MREFEFDYKTLSLQKKFQNLEENFPPEVCQEIPQFLRALKQYGEVSKADFFFGSIYKISAHTFELSYLTDFSSRKITIIDLQVKSLNLLKERFSISDSWDDKEVLPRIPQYDVPQKIIQAIELINKGIDDSYELGRKLGHRGKQKKYIARHGQYAKASLEELGLIKRTRSSRRLVSEITAKGKFIVDAPDDDTKKRLLVEAMLNYHPVWLVMGKVTEGGQKLTDRLVLDTIFPEEVQGADTSPRRAQTIKNWVKWISKYSGIPIHLDEEFLQLTIPMLYADHESE